MEINTFFDLIKTPAIVLHVLSVVLGMGAALTADVLFAFYSRDKKFNPTELKTLSILSHVVLGGLALISLTGVIIFLSDVSKYIESAKFLAKMTILAVLIVNGFLLHKYVWPHISGKGFFTLKRDSFARKISFTCGAISTISWISILILGVLDSVSATYNSLIFLYIGLLTCGITVALVVERRNFEFTKKQR